MLATIDQQTSTDSINFSVPSLGKFQKLRNTIATPKFGIGDDVAIKQETNIFSQTLIVNGI